MRYLLILLFITSAFVTSARAQTTKPRLVVNIVVGQMRYDYLLRFGANFSETGFKKMINQGVSCDRARYNYLTTSTASGLATISTGANPSSHGVIGGRWFNYTTGDTVELVKDKTCYTVGSDELDAQVSPRNLIASTLGDGLKVVSPQSKTISIALDPASAVIIGGHTADAAYWVSPRDGSFVSSTYYTAKLPEWVTKFNSQHLGESYSTRRWVIAKNQAVYQNILRQDIAVENNNSLNFDFLTRQKYDFGRLKATPAGNTLIRDFVAQAVINEQLGGDEFCDLLNVVFDPMRYIGEKYGSMSMEVEDAYYCLDQEIGLLIEFLEAQIPKDQLLVVLTSDHGANDPVMESSRMPSGRFNAEQYAVLMNGFLGATLGSGERWVLDYSNNQIYLNRRLIFDKGLDLNEIQNKIAAFAIQFRGVAQAITSNSMLGSHFSGGIMGMAQNSFFPRHSGDVIINLLPGWSQLNDRLSDSGSPYNYDTQVPLIWYGGAIGTQNIARDVDMTDLAPTVAHIMGIAPPNAATGSPVIEIYAK